MGLLAFQPGIVKYSAQNDKSACNLQNAWNFAKKKYGKQGGNYRLAQLGGRDKGGGQKFQTPAENTVPQNCGKYGQKQPHNNAAGPVREYPWKRVISTSAAAENRYTIKV